MDPDKTSGGSPDQDPTKSQVASPTIHIRLFFTTLMLPVLPFFIVLTYFCFPFFHHLLAHPSGTQGLLNIWCCLRHGLRSAAPCSCIMALGRGHLRHSLHSTKMMIISGYIPDPVLKCYSGGCLWLTTCFGPPKWSHAKVICLGFTPALGHRSLSGFLLHW